MYDFGLPESSRDRYNTLLQEAEQERLALRVKRGHAHGWTAQGLLRLSQWLIDTGSRLKAHIEMQPELSRR
jgi:hypothetical protein